VVHFVVNDAVDQTGDVDNSVDAVGAMMDRTVSGLVALEKCDGVDNRAIVLARRKAVVEK